MCSWSSVFICDFWFIVEKMSHCMCFLPSMLPFIKNNICQSLSDWVVRGWAFTSVAISKFVQCTMINDVKKYFNKLWGEEYWTFYLNQIEHSCDLLSCSLFSFSEKNHLHLQCNLRSAQYIISLVLVLPAGIAVFISQHIALTTSRQRYITRSLTECVTSGLTLSLMAAPFLKL